MKKEGNIYVITNYKFNHDTDFYEYNHPLDSRFLLSKNPYFYYLTDAQVPELLLGKNCILENTFDPLIKKAGKEHLAEWATFLCEYKYQFARYPMYIISSRFYQKNRYLDRDLDQQWDKLFDGLTQYGYGMLPSYDRPLRWIYPRYKDTIPKYQSRYAFFPFKRKAFELMEDLYSIKIERDFPHYTDFFCDYFGFQTYENFAKYFEFQKPILEYFFTENFDLKVDLSEYFYINSSDHRAEKPVTYLLEYFSHLYFAKNKVPFFAYHYTGLYEIQTNEKRMLPKEQYQTSFITRSIRLFNWMRMWVVLQSCWPKSIRTLVITPFLLVRKLIKLLRIKKLLPPAVVQVHNSITK